MSRTQLEAVLRKVDTRRRTFFWLLGATGLRISEAIGLQWWHVQLTGSNPHLSVLQRIVRGKMGAPKSRYGGREIPLFGALVMALVDHRRESEWPRESDYVFPLLAGTPLSVSNVFSRVLKPAADAADVPWIGFHTFRHTCASMLIAEGRDIVQVSRWLGPPTGSVATGRPGAARTGALPPPQLRRHLDRSATPSTSWPTSTGMTRSCSFPSWRQGRSQR